MVKLIKVKVKVKTRVMRSGFSILINLFVFCAFCQNPKIDFKNINAAFGKLENFKINLKYELFFDNESKPYETEDGVYKRKKNSYYMKQSDNEMLINEKYSLVIDNSNKVIILEKTPKKAKILNPLKMDIDSIFHFYEKVTFYRTGANKELSAYSFVLKQGQYSVIDIVFDPVTYNVKEITNVYREKISDNNDVYRIAKLKTVFADIVLSESMNDDFKETKYVLNEKGKIKITKPFTGYKLLTNLKKL